MGKDNNNMNESNFNLNKGDDHSHDCKTISYVLGKEEKSIDDGCEQQKLEQENKSENVV